jgi:hypothetical protein
MLIIQDSDTIFLAETAPIADSTIVETVAEVGSKDDHQPGAWAPIVVPTACSILVFVLGWILSRYFKAKDEKRSRYAYRALILEWVKLIKPFEDLFIQSLKEFSVSVKDSDDMQPEPFSVPQAIPHRLNELPLEKLTEVFLQDRKGQERIKSNVHFFNIVSGFEFLSTMSEQVRSNYARYNKQVLELCQEWNSVYTQFVDTLNSARFFGAYKPIKNSWDAAFRENRDSIKLHQYYITLFADKADSLKDKELIACTNRMQLIIDQRKAINTGFAQLFERMAEVTQESYDAMNEAVDFFA